MVEIRDGDLMPADTTSWKGHGRRLWRQVITSATATAFAIGRRSQQLHGLLGTALNG